MKELNAKKKTALLAVNILLSILLVMSMCVTVALAVTQFSLNMGGNISFQAKDVQATISKGVVANGTVEGDNKMQAITLTPDNDGAAEISSWSGLEISFNGKEDVTITFTVTNNHPEKSLAMTITPNIGTATNMEMKVEVNGRSNTRVIIPAVTNNVANCKITFHITNPNIGASISGFGIKYDLEVTDELPPPVYERVNEAGEPDENGEYLMFGYYPQTIKADNVTVGSTVQDNGFYLGSDGEEYAKVETEYFKVEQLKWRILDEQPNGETLIVCDTIIDNEAYQPNYKSNGDYYYATDESGNIIMENGEKVYANNYKHSNLRSFLNNEFYNSAFGSEEKSIILQKEVDNSLESTMNRGGQYVCENTNDNVFALSLADVNNEEYGFMNNYETSEKDPKKAFIVSDYAEAKGCYVSSTGTGFGWVRSPYDNSDGRYAFAVRGGLYDDDYVYDDYYGVVPALHIQL